MNRRGSSALISSLSLALVQTQAAGWKRALLGSVTCALLYLEVANSGLSLHTASVDKEQGCIRGDVYTYICICIYIYTYIYCISELEVWPQEWEQQRQIPMNVLERYNRKDTRLVVGWREAHRDDYNDAKSVPKIYHSKLSLTIDVE